MTADERDGLRGTLAIGATRDRRAGPILPDLAVTSVWSLSTPLDLASPAFSDCRVILSSPLATPGRARMPAPPNASASRYYNHNNADNCFLYNVLLTL